MEFRGRARAAADIPVPPERDRSRERPLRAATTDDANNRRAVSRLSGNIASLTTQMQQLMNVVTAQQQQIQMLAERPPQVVTQPLPPPSSPVPTLPAQTPQGSPQAGQCSLSSPSTPPLPTFTSSQNVPRSSGVATGPTFGPSNSFGVSGENLPTGVTVPTIVLPGGQAIPLGGVTSAASAIPASSQHPGGQYDPMQRSDKWLPELPKIEDSGKWKTRVDEICGFEDYMDRLISWLGLSSDIFSGEVRYAMGETNEILNDTLSPSQISRGIRLTNILKQSFSGIAKAQVIIAAYMESQPNYRVNGFEIVRLLSREYGIRTRSEALHFKTKLCEKVFKAVSVTEVVKHIEYEWSRYMKLLRSLDPGIARDGLFLLDTDLAMLLLRSLDAEVRSYCLMHAKSEDFQGLREAALRFESTQRLWSEFGGRGNNNNVLNPVVDAKGKKGKEKGKGKDKGKNKDKGKGGTKESKGKGQSSPNREVDMSKVKCFRCNQTGHYARDCKNNPVEKPSGKAAPKPKANQQKGGKGNGKRKNINELVGDQPDTELSPTGADASDAQPLISMILGNQFCFSPRVASDFRVLPVCGQFAFQSDACSHFGSECVGSFNNTLKREHDPGDYDLTRVTRSCFGFGFKPDLHYFPDILSDSFFCDVSGCPDRLLMPVVASCPDSEPKDALAPVSSTLCDESFSDETHVDYWLLDSGASSSVVSESSLSRYEVISESQVGASDGTYTAANGETIRMVKYVTLQLHIHGISHENGDHATVLPCRASCLVAKNLEHNVLSLGSLLSKGWSLNCKNGEHSHEYLIEKDGHSLIAVVWQNCPWLMHQRSNLSSSDEQQVFDICGNPKFFHMPLQQIPSHLEGLIFDHGSNVLQPSVKRKAEIDAEGEDDFARLMGDVGVSADGPGHMFHEPKIDDDVFPSDMSLEVSKSHADPSAGIEQPPPLPSGDIEIGSDPSSQHPAVMKKADRVSLEKHRLHGHYPFHPDCLACKQAKGTTQHRRRTKKGLPVTELYADFFFYGLGDNGAKTDFKFLALYDAATGMVGAVPMSESDVRTIGSWVVKWLGEFNVLGLSAAQHPLEVVTDKEQQVGNILLQSNIGREISLKRASPQSHEALGAVESAIRRIKEGVATLRTDLRSCGVDLNNNKQSIATSIAYVCMCNNLHSSFGDGKKSPKEISIGRALPDSTTSLFGSVVLAEVPQSLSDVAVSRFIRAIYLRPEFSSLGHVVVSIVGGEKRIFVAKSIKLLQPLQFDVALANDFLQNCNEYALREPKGSPEAPVRVVDAVDIESIRSVPASFIREHGKTDGCGTCLRDSFHGYKHSAGCVRRYQAFLRDQWKGIEGDKVELRVEPSQSSLPEGARRLLHKQPRPDFLPEPGAQRSADIPDVRFPQEDLDMGDYSPSTPRDHEGDPPEGAMDVDLGVGGVDDSGQLSPDISILEAESSEHRMVDMVTEFDPFQTESIEHKVHSMISAIFYKKDQPTAVEDISLCGTSLRLHRPHYAISDVTGEWLDIDLVMSGIRVEVFNMTEQLVGTVCTETEAKNLCQQHSIRVITTRWVVSLKEPGLVRSRLVARELKKGGPHAKDMGISSPTSSVESLRSMLAEASASDMVILGLDVSAAFMASPLRRPTILKLPNSFTFENGDPCFLSASKALNGLRASGSAWTDHLRDISKQGNLDPGQIESTIFTGYYRDLHHVTVISYVDDLLIFAPDMDIAEEIFAIYSSQLTVKETGRIQSSAFGGGHLKFLGRHIQRDPGDKSLRLWVESTYLDTCFSDFNLTKGTEVPPDLRPVLDDDSPGGQVPLTEEAVTRYKSCLGKLSWLAQSRCDLTIYAMLLATGMSKPLARHEKALRMVLRWLLTQMSIHQSFPAPELPITDGHSDGLVAFCDASWAPLLTLKRRSISGSYVFYRGSLVKAYSRLQVLIALSSCEAELAAIAECGVELAGIKRMVEHVVGRPIEASVIYTDSQAAVRVAYNQGLSRKSRHLEIRIFWVQQQLMDRMLFLLWCSGEDQVADMATKSLGRKLFEKFQYFIGFTHYGPRFLPKIPSGKEKQFKSLTFQAMVDDHSRGEDASVLSSAVGSPKTIERTVDVNQRCGIVLCSSLHLLVSHPSMVFIEICCGKESLLTATVSQMFHDCLCIRVPICTPIQRFGQNILRFLREQKQAKVFVHISAPCTGDSPLLSLAADEDNLREKHFNEFLDILSASENILEIGEFSFELPAKSRYWRTKQLQDFFMRLSRHRELLCGLIKLCQLGECVENGTAIGKTFWIVSSHRHFISVINQSYSQGNCNHEHAALSQANWPKTGLYPQSMCNLICKGIKAFFEGSSSQKISDVVVYRPGIRFQKHWFSYPQTP